MCECCIYVKSQSRREDIYTKRFPLLLELPVTRYQNTIEYHQSITRQLDYSFSSRNCVID